MPYMTVYFIKGPAQSFDRYVLLPGKLIGNPAVHGHIFNLYIFFTEAYDLSILNFDIQYAQMLSIAA
ncbi:hypothetical protein SDC9_183186 [bioreactor metagenome]|uniref:Uncharacterized protein n=1 Tax=bioreactor metagenome TaxID=1076179 RepID=A0A645H9M6_9ZZZZ